MPATPRRARKFGGSAHHQKLMMANLAASLFAAEGIVTTEGKAKAVLSKASTPAWPRKRATPNHAPHGRPMAQAKAQADKLTASERTTTDHSTGSALRIK